MSDEMPFPAEGQEDVEQREPWQLTVFTNINKDAIKTAAGVAGAEVIERGDPLERYVDVKAMTEYLTEVGKVLKGPAQDQLDNIGGKEVVIMGCKVEKTSAADQYEYPDDPVLEALEEQLQEIKDKIKAHKDLRKSAMQFENVVDKDGVVLEPAVRVAGGGEIFRVTIPKTDGKKESK